MLPSAMTEEEFDKVAKTEVYVDLLSKIEIFMGFSRPKRFDMAITFEEVVFNKDEIIIRQGEKANFFYIIVHGEVIVCKRSVLNQVVIQQTLLNEGCSFGALPIFFNTDSHVTVKANNQVTCARMSRTSFEDLVSPELKSMERNAQAYYQFINSIEK